jgi:hypothetical protein
MPGAGTRYISSVVTLPLFKCVRVSHPHVNQSIRVYIEIHNTYISVIRIYVLPIIRIYVL